ncbi:D-sedoheptulose 7-phosphate isomerase [Blochmannia endosymbiont of Camponotus (Colobopsis) obliquus]|uniref:D-sedoheptulose 7-phosphate isomerase n=1 Tax=Blochmannia endosymbiont of Camponotus (Colobopsis) obliquus TaxID=1505597 RepID=UPI00061A7F64|nr:D-sedoheptulose 7-phosphate isomerase [Blochmannia endosymbiont of Camponotus (Colobopsis) obliquus]AKC60396.1 phosphoheptose isomerase [Blochmannia endosymbiont of Camponotus (Colobopsis) obliquus]
MYHKMIFNEFNDIKNSWDAVINNKSYVALLESAAHLIVDVFKVGGKILTCGNGGSHCNAIHFAEELTGRYRDDRFGYPALAISDACHISCVGNDFGYEYVFSRYIEALGKRNDILLTITTSGKSINILRAIEAAYIKNMYVIVFTGNTMREFVKKVDIEICVPYFKYADRVQEIHMKFIHVLILIVEQKMSNVL